MKKTIIANWGSANQGKSATIKKVTKLLIEEYPLSQFEPATIDFTGDVKVVIIIEGFKIGIESVGDPKSRLLESLNKFSDSNCDLILCSTRNYGSTAEAVEALREKGYEIIWTTNHRSDDGNHELLNSISAKQIFELIQSTLFPREYPKIVYKYRGWEKKEHRSILLNNELYFASPKKFNDPFDCRIYENYFLIEEDELDEWVKNKVQFGIDGGRVKESNREKMYLEIINKFANRQNLQDEKNRLGKEMQDNHFGVFALTSRWDSILMWSHYADCHKGYCVGFDEIKLRELIGQNGHLIKGGQVSYQGYPLLKPPSEFDADYALKLGFIQTHSKSNEWEYEDEYRLLKTIYPKSFTDKDHFIEISNECLKEVILGIQISDIDKKEILHICEKKGIPVYQALQVPFHFKMIRTQIS